MFSAVYYGHFYVALVCICMCSVSWLLWLSSQYWPNDLTPFHTKPKSTYDFFGLLHCFIIEFSCFPALHDIFHATMGMARYSLFVLKVPLNTNQLTISFLFNWNIFERLIQVCPGPSKASK